MKHIKTISYLNDNDIFNAIYDNDLYKVKSLINRGINLECLNIAGNTPLYYSILFNNHEITKELIKAGANVNSKNGDTEETPLMVAIRYKKLDIIEELIKYNVDLNQTDLNLRTALITASLFTSIIIDIIIKPIEAGTDWNIKDKYNKDFLDYLPDYKKQKIIELYPEKYQEYLMKKEAEEKYNL